MNNQRKMLPARKAIFWIFASLVLISGSVSLSFIFFNHVRQWRANDDKFRVVAIVQTGPEREALKTEYLAELLNLSVDQPTNLYHFNSKEAVQKLLLSPLIKEASVKKILPGTVYIDYTVRKPIAFLGDYTNTALDEEGVVFPFKPFFTPKKLPEIYLGIATRPEAAAVGKRLWGIPMKEGRAKLALSLLKKICKHCCDSTCHVVKIDVSKAFASSYGQRQIVVVMEEQMEKKQGDRLVLCYFPHILRLTKENFLQELASYNNLKPYLRQQHAFQNNESALGEICHADPIVIDLRIPQLAFVKK